MPARRSAHESHTSSRQARAIPFTPGGARAAASALSSAVVLAVVNLAAADIAAKKGDLVSVWMAVAFVAGVLLYAAAESWTVARMGAGMEEAIDGLRMRLLERLRHADLFQLERFGETPCSRASRRAARPCP